MCSHRIFGESIFDVVKELEVKQLIVQLRSTLSFLLWAIKSSQQNQI